MGDLSFLDLNLTPKVKRAIDDMGFEMATSIQSQAIPLIRTGVDVIGRSQTGTGKTVAFTIPAIERIDTHEERSTVQVLILCPTRELAQQVCGEVRRLTKYKTGIRPVEVYGGAPMGRQILALKSANLVIGTPGRVMDHMRRRTLRLEQVKMVVLDEADEMLSMGFKEDIETILRDTPDDRQTVLFSATMPPAILKLTREFQKEPQMIEVNRKQVTLENIAQSYLDVPMGRKKDALSLLLHYHQPSRAMVFCNTKQMVEELTEYLIQGGFQAEGLHGDMKQMQRTKVMDGFKQGKTAILVATDVAARGIDVSGIDYVFNYDLPQNTEYYVHRIGRTGRAGNTGRAVTLCSGRKQVWGMRDIARAVKSEIQPEAIPPIEDVQAKLIAGYAQQVETVLAKELPVPYIEMARALTEKGHDPLQVAAAALLMQFGQNKLPIEEIKAPVFVSAAAGNKGGFQKVVVSIGRSSRVAPNHIVGAITERTGMRGSQVGKIEIYDDYTVVGIPGELLDEVVEQMNGCKICGKPVAARLFREKPGARPDGRAGGGGMLKKRPRRTYSR